MNVYHKGRELSHQTPCHACKYQRKRCPASCILRRHFQEISEDDFESVQKIFGIAKVKRMLYEVNSWEEKKEVAKSIIWEAAMWIQDPVQGPYGCFKRLQEKLEELREHARMQFESELPSTLETNRLLPNNPNTLLQENGQESEVGLVPGSFSRASQSRVGAWHNREGNGNMGRINYGYPRVRFHHGIRIKKKENRMTGHPSIMNNGHQYNAGRNIGSTSKNEANYREQRFRNSQSLE